LTTLDAPTFHIVSEIWNWT